MATKDTRAQQIVLDLNAKGISNSQIAKILGRDSSYISQIRRGKRTGESFIPALQAIQSGQAPVEGMQAPPIVERKKTKAGVEAKVRTSPFIKEEGKVISFTTSTPNGPQTMKVLQDIANKDGRIGLSVDLKQFQAYGASKPTKGTTALWTKWYSARSVIQKMNEEGLTFSELIERNISDRSNVEIAQGVRKVTINVDYTPVTTQPINVFFPNR